jgi:hypothetical protein
MARPKRQEPLLEEDAITSAEDETMEDEDEEDEDEDDEEA